MTATAKPPPVIVVTEPLNDRTLKYLAEHGELRRVAIEDLPKHIAQADALIVRTYTQVDEALLAQGRRLKVVGRAGVALENVDLAACRRRGVQVVHTPAANTLAVVDYTVGMIIQMNRRFWPMTGPVPEAEFHQVRKQTFGRFLAGVTLGIIGCGRIGSRVGRAAVGLGMTVLYNDIIPIELDYPAEAVDKPTLYARSDVVTIHVPLTRLTRKLICAETLRQFKRGAQFINAARGPCVDYDDLAAAIRAGHIAAAAIDCHDPEPPPADYPLFGLDNVILTPHTAARVPAAVEAMCEVVYDVVAVLEGRAPAYPAKDEEEP
ncbi:MAG: phosphoglycerate dehydrogenase [Phycisphaerae bacterium]|nr:phosphoglycerate dehydrogenase [Phycisphaerae bacterium]